MKFAQANAHDPTVHLAQQPRSQTSQYAHKYSCKQIFLYLRLIFDIDIAGTTQSGNTPEQIFTQSFYYPRPQGAVI